MNHNLSSLLPSITYHSSLLLKAGLHKKPPTLRYRQCLTAWPLELGFLFWSPTYFSLDENLSYQQSVYLPKHSTVKAESTRQQSFCSPFTFREIQDLILDSTLFLQSEPWSENTACWVTSESHFLLYLGL